MHSQHSSAIQARVFAKAAASWNHTPTRAIRVPEVFVDDLLAIAREWDRRDRMAKTLIGIETS
jgi:hypothetical protein